MILTKPEILKAVHKKKISITPFNKNQLGPASYDLTLDNQFRIFKKVKLVKLDDNINKLTKILISNSYIIKPSEFILGITKENIKLSNNLCATLSGRSTYARKGLTVHITASFVQPGVNNKQVLEIKNVSPNPIELKAGAKICQIRFEEAKGSASYDGRYKKQSSV
jgi:dCTP deaminase